jgi:hypothetical protein
VLGISPEDVVCGGIAHHERCRAFVREGSNARPRETLPKGMSKAGAEQPLSACPALKVLRAFDGAWLAAAWEQIVADDPVLLWGSAGDKGGVPGTGDRCSMLDEAVAIDPPLLQQASETTGEEVLPAPEEVPAHLVIDQHNDQSRRHSAARQAQQEACSDGCGKGSSRHWGKSIVAKADTKLASAKSCRTHPADTAGRKSFVSAQQLELQTCHRCDRG